MPTTEPYPALCTGYTNRILPSNFNSFDILLVEFHAGDNITPKQAEVPYQEAL